MGWLILGFTLISVLSALKFVSISGRGIGSADERIGDIIFLITAIFFGAIAFVSWVIWLTFR